MGNKKAKPRLTEPWRRIHGAIWLIGIAILAWQNWWWPGILVLVALSSILEAILMQKVPEAFEVPSQPQPQADQTAPASPAEPPLPSPYPLHRLPSECPQCGAPLRPQALVWDTPNAAHCPYCGVLLPLKAEQT
ncbi:MAG: hypothetical protein DDG59_03845 [Anaerolineae bacterium]|jgi:hypothetical protein|nr:MAG: hypothetical protein DDG59_03845 [Anaerolineae bacterium]